MVIIVVAMECVWLLVCACAGLEFSVRQRFVSLRVYLLASISFVESTFILSLQWRSPQDRRPIASLPLSWPCTWTSTTSHTPDLRGRERIAYGATCRRRTHPCEQSASDPGHSDTEQPDEGTEQSDSEQSGTSGSSAMQTAADEDVTSAVSLSKFYH